MIQQVHTESPQAPVDRFDVAEAVELGIKYHNPLLLEYCEQELTIDDPLQHHIRPALHEQYDRLEKGTLLRWLDTPLYGAEFLPHDQIRAHKIARTVRWIKDLVDGNEFISYVAVPALNEEDEITHLLDSAKRQHADSPIGMVVADNNSTDHTAEVVKHAGGTVVKAPVQGIGPARQATLDAILRYSTAPLDRTLIVQTDSDCQLAPGYVQATKDAFAQNPDKSIGVGMCRFEVPLENGETLTISNAREYGNITGAKTLKEYFKLCGRDIKDYLLEAPFLLYPGGNTAYRANIFPRTGVGYPVDRRWEQHDVSIRLQRQLPASDSVIRSEGQVMHVSPRAILGDANVLTDERRRWLREHSIGVFKGTGHTALSTVAQTIHDIDVETYKIDSASTRVDAITHESAALLVSESCTPHSTHLYHPAIHSGTGDKIAGKVAILGF